jgi:anti-sigma factor RsiW
MLSVYIDDRLEIGKTQHLRSHLDGCVPCKAYLSDLRDIRRMFRSARESSLPNVDLWPSLRSRLPIKRRWVWWEGAGLRWNGRLSTVYIAGGVALALSILVGSLLVMQRGRDDRYLEVWASRMAEQEMAMMELDNPAKALFIEAWESASDED